MKHPLRFGCCVPTFAFPGGRLFRTPGLRALDAPAALQTAVRAEALGYHSLWVADHLMLGQDQAVLEGWTTLAAIAGATQRARLGLIHQAHFFRHPAVAAKMLATLDQLSGGRVIFFADAGTQPAEHRHYGLPYPAELDQRMSDFLEGLELMLELWQSSVEAPVTFQGRVYHAQGAVCQPPPVQQPHPPLWFGEAHPLTLEATARLGQGWNSAPASVSELARRLEALRAACANVGRGFDELEISLETQVLVAPTRADVREKLRALLALAPDDPPAADVAAFAHGATDAYPPSLAAAGLIGTPAEVVAQVAAYRALGVSHFLLWFLDAPEEAGMTLFAEQVAANFVAAARVTAVGRV